jgi:ABC transporter DrrB family efflux protein
VDAAVTVEGLTKRFGATLALDGVDLEVAEGSVLGLLGPNGAGKTTVVRVLATLLKPDGGRARVLGRDVLADPGGVRELIGLTGQFAAVDEILSGRENLRMFARLFGLSAPEAARRADDLLERLGLADAAGRPARTYSGGMRRRLDLASSLVTRPRVLFLDEPTTGLDPRSRNGIWDAVRELVSDGTTLVLTTQYLEEADVLADRIAVMDHGRIVAQGTGDELKDRAGGATVQVRVTQAGERGRALEALAGLDGAQPGAAEDLVVLQAPRDGVGVVSAAAGALRAAGVGVSDLALRRPTLDEVFLQLTGPGAAGPPRAAADAPAPARRAPRAASAAERARLRWSRAAPASDGAAPPARPVAAPRPRPTAAGVRRALADCAVVAGRNLRHFVRQPQLLLFSTIQPVMFVLLFAYVFGGAIERSLPRGTDYIDFLLPGIFVQSAAFRATQTSAGLAEDLARGVIDRFRSMPMARAAVLVGRTSADLVRNVLIVGLMVAVGHLVGFRFSEGPLAALGSVAVVALFSYSLSWIFAFVALTVKGQEAVNSAGFLAIFPLVFASSVFVPVETMPGWLEAFAKVSPVTLSADAARALAIGGEVGGPLAGALAWSAGLLLVFVPLCVWRWSRMG